MTDAPDAIFDKMAARVGEEGFNRWGHSYLEVRDEYRRNHPDDPARLPEADAAIIEALGDDYKTLFDFAMNMPGYFYGKAVLFGEEIEFSGRSTKDETVLVTPDLMFEWFRKDFTEDHHGHH